jgi:hypothetical protein
MLFDTRARQLLKLHDCANRLLSTKMNIPCNFLRIGQWYELFGSLGLKIEKCTRIYQYPMLDVTHQVLFELTVNHKCDVIPRSLL